MATLYGLRELGSEFVAHPCLSSSALRVSRPRSNVLAPPLILSFSLLVPTLRSHHSHPCSPEDGVWPFVVLVVLTVCLMSDTIFQRYLANLEYVDFVNYSAEIVDTVALGLSLLPIAILMSPPFMVRQVYTLENFTRLRHAWFGSRYYLWYGLGRLGLLKYASSLYRYSCWRSVRMTKHRRALHVTDTAKDLRRHVFYLSVASIVLLTIVTTIWFQMAGLRETFLAWASNTIPILSSFAPAIPSGLWSSTMTKMIEMVNDTSDRNCLRFIQAHRDGQVDVFAATDLVWWYNHSPYLSYQIVNENSPHTTLSFIDIACISFQFSSLIIIINVVICIGILVYVFFVSWLGQGSVVRPLIQLLYDITQAAARLGPNGMVLGVGEQGESRQVTMSIEEAVRRVGKAVKLLAKASLRGRVVIQRMLTDANNQGAGHERGLLEIYGVAAGVAKSKPGRPTTKQNLLGPGMEARARLSDEEEDFVEKVSQRAADMEGYSVRGGIVSLGRNGRVTLGRNRLTKDSSISRSGTHTDRSYHPEWSGRTNPPRHFIADFDDVDELVRTPRSDHGAWLAEAVDLIVAMYRDLGLVRDDSKRGLRSTRRFNENWSVESGSDATGSPEGDSGTGSKGGGKGLPAEMEEDALSSGGSLVLEKTLRQFVEVVASQYQDHPFHNMYRAVDVQHTMFCLLKKARIFRHRNLRKLEVLTLMITSLCLDLGHQGISNHHMIRTGHILALTYNDKSPNENMHASSIFHICLKEGCNLMELLSTEEAKEFRNLIVTLILASDPSKYTTNLDALILVMARHIDEMQNGSDDEGDGNYSSSTKTRPSDSGSGFSKDSHPDGIATARPPPTSLSGNDLMAVMMGLVLASDLGFCLKRPQQHIAWARCLVEEHFQEVDMAMELGIQTQVGSPDQGPTPIMSRQRTYVPLAMMSIIDTTARPLFVTLGHVVPELGQVAPRVAVSFMVWCLAAARDKASKGRLEQARPALLRSSFGHRRSSQFKVQNRERILNLTSQQRLSVDQLRNESQTFGDIPPIDSLEKVLVKAERKEETSPNEVGEATDDAGVDSETKMHGDAKEEEDDILSHLWCGEERTNLFLSVALPGGRKVTMSDLCRQAGRVRDLGQPLPISGLETDFSQLVDMHTAKYRF